MKGSYILLINLPKAQRIRVGSLGIVDFLSGCYAYVGSALRGFESRLPHHLGNSKKPHWHIDYLLQKAPITSIIIFESDKRVDCMIAKALEGQFAYVLDFSCSDCRCKSHLFFAPDPPSRRHQPNISRRLRFLPAPLELAQFQFNQPARGVSNC